MRANVHIVRTLADWEALKVDPTKRHVADVETALSTVPEDGKLLGIALAPLVGQFANGADAAYVVINEYLFKQSEWKTGVHDSLYSVMGEFFETAELIGHNHTYDRGWLDHFFSIRTKWHADTRLMWHMASAPSGPKGYGLKDAQIEVLKWEERGDVMLAQQIKARGGKPGPDMYLADTDVLGYYAGLDAFSTAQLYDACKYFFDSHGSWWLLEKMVRYSQLIDWNTRSGVHVNVPKLESEVQRLAEDFVGHRDAFVATISTHVEELETQWRNHQGAKYQRDSDRQKFFADPKKWKRFNPASDIQKRELFYGVMGLPVVETVKARKDKKTGRRVKSKNPAVSFDAVTMAMRESRLPGLDGIIEAYANYEHTETMYKNFASKWLEATRNNRIHPGFNPCGTVSYRLSGFKPYFLNLPFDETALMNCFSCDEGYGGVHADLVSIEPAVTAHYSQDPSLLKVFRDGLGDVYLDLALTLFPADEDLRLNYNPNVPVTGAIKERFKKPRKVAKIVQLAVQYTGTKFTVSKNLSRAGVKTTLAEGDRLVRDYWKHFARVDAMNEALFELNRRKGYLRNVIGRVVRVPSPDYKDLPNRFIQSSAHDILSLWVMRIYELCEERRIDIKPVLIDCHDSTSNQCPKEQVPALEQAYVDALADVNSVVRMTVPAKAEIKRFHTLAGLKGDDNIIIDEQEAA